jgi:uncharacterized protein YdbL (DUF1318 family)
MDFSFFSSCLSRAPPLVHLPSPQRGKMSDWQASKKAGNEAFTAGKAAEAAEHYTTALTDAGMTPADRATILCNRAQCYLNLAKNEAARDDCTACLALSPGNVKALFRRCERARGPTTQTVLPPRAK